MSRHTNYILHDIATTRRYVEGGLEHGVTFHPWHGGPTTRGGVDPACLHISFSFASHHLCRLVALHCITSWHLFPSSWLGFFARTSRCLLICMIFSLSCIDCPSFLFAFARCFLLSLCDSTRLLNLAPSAWIVGGVAATRGGDGVIPCMGFNKKNSVSLS